MTRPHVYSLTLNAEELEELSDTVDRAIETLDTNRRAYRVQGHASAVYIAQLNERGLRLRALQTRLHYVTSPESHVPPFTRKLPSPEPTPTRVPHANEYALRVINRRIGQMIYAQEYPR